MICGEVQNPQRNLPWALVLGMLMIIGLYVAANITLLHALSLQDILSANSSAHPEATSFASRAAAAAFGSGAGVVVSLLFMISASGTLHCNMLAVPLIYVLRWRMMADYLKCWVACPQAPARLPRQLLRSLLWRGYFRPWAAMIG